MITNYLQVSFNYTLWFSIIDIWILMLVIIIHYDFQFIYPFPTDVELVFSVTCWNYVLFANICCRDITFVFLKSYSLEFLSINFSKRFFCFMQVQVLVVFIWALTLVLFTILIRSLLSSYCRFILLIPNFITGLSLL